MIISYNELSSIQNQSSNKKLVLTSGTFDLFHVGHLHYLQAVKSHGDIIVVMLSGDERIKSRKNNSRPVIPENERAEILNALKIVDYIFIDAGNGKADDPTYADILTILKPDIYATDGEDIRFSAILEKHGVKFELVPRVKAGKYESTSVIINQIANF